MAKSNKILGRDRNSIIASFVLFAISAIVYGSLAYETHFIIDSFSFKETKGFITKSYYSKTRSSNSASTRYVIHLEYNYTVDDVEYSGNKVDTSIALRDYLSVDDAADFVKEHPTSKEVTVHYKKASPNTTFLYGAINLDLYIIMGFFATGFLYVGIRIFKQNKI